MTRHVITVCFAAALLAGVPKHAAACWTPVVTPAALTFTVAQPDGTTISGEFTRFDGTLCLDPKDPGAGRLRLSVATASVHTRLPEMDRALRGPLFFASKKWTQAGFKSQSIRKLEGGDHYQVKGTFTLRGTAKTIEVPFTFTPAADNASARLEGETAIKRLDYGVGQGQWADSRWAGNKVTLKFSVKLIRSDDKRE
jgi:polyisoprenoid-binding protein YceI